jgi:hypothetical protein
MKALMTREKKRAKKVRNPRAEMMMTWSMKKWTNKS